MPWINVIANERFGFLVSESGAGTTWSANSREHRLTPWSNDAVLDPHGEAVFVSDLDSDETWSALPGPVAGHGEYEVRHGLGVSTFRHASRGLACTTSLFVTRDDPVKVVRVTIVNRSGAPRRIALTAYHRLVMGALPEESSRFVRTAVDPGEALALARNPMAGPFAGGVAFAALVAPAGVACSMTTDREGFLGRGGTVAVPRALAAGGALDGRAGAGLDPCFATRGEIALAQGGAVECAFLLGEESSEDAARSLVARLRQPEAIGRAHDEATAFWRETVSRVRIETPEPALDLMVNAWLPYQTLSCRMWGRAGFYQSSGAFGFRDQLQDALSLVPLRPDLARAQIALHAAHQFVEGDVLHWWHPPAGRGMRTRFVDDLLWLPWLAATYVRATGDASVLDERAPFVTAPALEPGEDEAFVEARDSGASADVYEHASRAIDRSLATGAHGLPLFGSGDWNDGMNRVGREGRGESVWMGFFLYAVIGDFLPLAERRGDVARVERWRAHRVRLRDALEAGGWDGDWYRRGYYDDGTPLGTRGATECRIDGLVQGWSVISGAAPLERAHRAMGSGERLLVSERDGLIRLLTPAFQDTPLDPGYIKGYVRGVRENGGQYTHGVLWFVRAAAELGWRDRAARWLAMLSPVGHTCTPEDVARYQVEPYVVAADVYGEPPHVGRGGWTWYTGSSGWMHRVALESVLGLTWHGGTSLRVSPRVPDTWPGFRAVLRVPGDATAVDVVVRNPHGNARAVVRATLDDAPARIDDGIVWIDIPRDGAAHVVRIELGDGAEPGEGVPVAMAEARGAASRPQR
jgi:cyclic beta-1,2-glucan synthetase